MVHNEKTRSLANPGDTIQTNPSGKLETAQKDKSRKLLSSLQEKGKENYE